MRYLHLSTDELCEYVQSLGLTVMRCERSVKSSPVETDVAAIKKVLEISKTLWGAILPYYLSIATSIDAEAPPLEDAVSRVEASPIASRFLVIGYEDGGVISVSGSTLPFQAKAKPAEWWTP